MKIKIKKIEYSKELKEEIFNNLKKKLDKLEKEF